MTCSTCGVEIVFVNGTWVHEDTWQSPCRSTFPLRVTDTVGEEIEL